MRTTGRRMAMIAGATLMLTPWLVQAQVFGSLANFDVVNSTGHTAYGFEIEIEDSAFDHPGRLGSIFGYDRVFSFVGPDAGDVVRYGRPTISYEPGFGVRIVYGGTVGPNFTESKPYSTSGESCWPGANANWRSTSCDHFGVSTYGTPAKTTYSWLVDVGGGIAKQPVVVPNVVFTPVYAPPPALPPPVPAPPIGVVAVAAAQQVAADPRDNAFWVKITQTELAENVDLGDLLGGDHPGARPEIAALKDKPETEVEWQVLQIGQVDEVSKALDPKGNPSVVVSFEFFKYTGSFDDEGLVDPNKDEFPDAPGFDPNALQFVGRQMAGFNAVQAMAPVPEPQTWALMLGGLALMATARRRKARPKQKATSPPARQNLV
jgi:hypothetical protein